MFFVKLKFKIMKKLFTKLFIIASSTSLFSQVLIEQNCDNFALGNISSTVDNSIAGQGGWRVIAQQGTALSNFQIVDANPQYGKVFQLQGSSIGSGSRYIYNPDLVNFWADRIVGNDIIEFEVDFFTGSSISSNSGVDFSIYDTTGTIVLCGLDYYPINQNLYGVAYSIDAITGIANNIYINPPTPIVLQPNTWYKLGASFNKTTGQILYKGAVNGIPFSFSFNGAGANLDAGEFDFINAPEANNTASITNQFDNIIIRATSTDNLLNTVSTQIAADKFLISPNPANDFVKISGFDGSNIKNIELIDLNGRTIKSEQFNDLSAIELNLLSVSKGIYLLKIATENGLVSKKIIKN